MQEKLADEIVKLCPKLFGHLSYFEIEDGWFELVKEMSSKIELIISKLDLPEDELIYCVQLKQKYGGLRVYLTNHTPEIDQIIKEAEQKAHQTCEYCGEPGVPHNANGWITVLCKNCIDPDSQHEPVPDQITELFLTR